MAYSALDLRDTIVALATPPGVGAIGVIRLSGPKAIEIVNGVFPGKDLLQQKSHTVHFGTIRGEGERIIDEVLVTLFVAPTSYTGENVVEVSCHGSNYIIQELIRLFIKKGARLAQAGEFTLRAFLNGRMDLSQAEAVADLIASDSERSHDLALQQMRGGISQEIAELRQQLIDFASLIELELDFAEEDVEFANRGELRVLVEKIQRLIRQLLDSFRLGNAIKQGVTTVIAGRPNAGKSTLLNALLNEERAIVSEIAGTTRDTIEEVLNIDGVLFRIVDTAGIRDAQDQIEAIGVEKTLEKVRQSSLLIYVFDVIRTSPEEVRTDLDRLIHSNVYPVVVANKMDLNPYTKREHYFPASEARFADLQWVPIVAKESMNIPHLKEVLYQAVLSEKVGSDETIISNARHFEALEKAYTSLTDVLNGMNQQITSDFIAMDIRRALSYLGEITGEVSTDDLLGNIFSRFCIGK
ncbi:tRNA uridine-5-carboxymethylaminomethyl(34) synthesis GTPase MnmE [Flavilitoribacter nigricans]|uniref:tRNA modification GTPase MnmE n=1 Tax=Flavilitoribacter nigricans (strain ATCC 23147 / DSM 23189 / NBRC 102662 / NCIMB 1420 / SS-2) TaxID=1122177 RepID=A0A2D0NAF8_FLAN2|nr:tRNA uridine-5-carboxymethylaminomethyl(34) synthesis GTPase MnmE [Flavilitoribacter nigricans]PHN05494.1 tRNA uridine-5-carboxymethylaminomethyl(34) synthesis GTPase MnmE [Flavilitoribacter nigricans DSM 23189 = NBRC 102662]